MVHLVRGGTATSVAVAVLCGVAACGGQPASARVRASEVATLRPGQSLDVSGTLVSTKRSHMCIRDAVSVICAALDPPGTRSAYNPMALPFDLRVGQHVRGTVELFDGRPRFLGWASIGMWH